MRYPSLVPSILALGAVALAGCSADATAPNAVQPAGPSVPASAVAANSWLSLTDMLTTRADLAVATVTNAAGQSIVYTIGGRNPNGVPLKTVSAYNVATNTWTFRRALPVALAWTNGAAAINGKIYVSGGFSDYGQGDGYASRALYMYDPAANTWTRKHDMPSLNKPPEYHSWIVGAEGVTGAINGKLYVVTACYAANEPWGYEEGCDSEGGGMFFRYNPATDQWASLPSPFAEPPGVGSDAAPPFAGGVIAGKLYVMGSSRWTRENHFAAYDPATNRWTTKTPLGQMRPGAAAAVLGGKLYLFGGRRFNAKLQGFETLDKTLRYDPITNLWTTRASMPSARTGIAATPVTVNGQARIEVIGGPAPGNNLQYVP